MLASGTVQEIFFYRCLAHYLGVAFIEGRVRLGRERVTPIRFIVVAPLDGRDGHRWLFAPRGEMLAEFLTRARRGERFSTAS